MTSKHHNDEHVSAEDVARAFREQSPNHERLYREAEAKAALSIKMKLLRQTEGISQTELASRIGRKQSFIARLEQGGYDRCGVSTLRTILRAMRYDFSFQTMFVRLTKAAYSGESACDTLEIAFEADESFANSVANYAKIRWSIMGDVTPEYTPDIKRDQNANAVA